jgi:hypothetical protein
VTLPKYDTKNGSPNDRRKRKRTLERDLEELRIKSGSDGENYSIHPNEEIDVLEDEGSE